MPEPYSYPDVSDEWCPLCKQGVLHYDVRSKRVRCSSSVCDYAEPPTIHDTISGLVFT